MPALRTAQLNCRTLQDGDAPSWHKDSGQRLSKLVGTLAEGIPTPESSGYVPSHMVVPLGGTTAASGWQRYLSYRRKPTFVRQQPVQQPPLLEKRRASKAGFSDGSRELGDEEEEGESPKKKRTNKVRSDGCLHSPPKLGTRHKVCGDPTRACGCSPPCMLFYAMLCMHGASEVSGRMLPSI